MIFVAGRGVFASRDIVCGQFIVQYFGKIISGRLGNEREKTCQSGYRFFFHHNGVKKWYGKFIGVNDYALHVLMRVRGQH